MAGSKRILILTADAGFGHRSAANAIAAALDSLYGEQAQVSIVNPLDDRRVPFFLREAESDYDKLVRSLPELYKLGFDASDYAVPTNLIENAMTVLIYEVISDLIRQYKPHAIISTYPIYVSVISAVFTISRIRVPQYMAITDLATIHRLWLNKRVDGLFVPTPSVRELALNYGFRPEQVHVTGIPVNPACALSQRSPAEIRARLGLDPDRLTILAVGSRRVEHLQEALHVVNHFGYPLQLIAVTGKDKEMFNQLQEERWHIPVKIFEFTDDVISLMQASNLIICKAGGLIVTEALACGLPLILVDVIPGQETGNADYVISSGAGDLAFTEMQLLETLAHWVADDRRLLEIRSANARRAGRPEAALDAAKIVWEGAQQGPRPSEPAGRLSLIRLLKKNRVRWQWDEEPEGSQAS